MYQGTAEPTKLIVVGTTLYFADGLTPGNITAVNLVDGSVAKLAAETSTVTDLVVDDQSVFWLEGNALRQVSRDGGTAVDVITGLTLPNGLAADTSLFWVDRGNETAPGELLTAPKSGGQTSQLALGENYVGGLVGATAIDENNVYFGGWQGEVLAVSRSGGSVSVVAPSQSPAIIGVNGGFVYWINQTTQPDSPLRGLRRAPIAGGNIESVDENAIGNTIAFDGGYVFYLTPDAIAVRRQ